MIKCRNDGRYPRGQAEGIKTEDRQRDLEQWIGGKMSHRPLAIAW